MRDLILKEYAPRSILNVHKHIDGGWFWDKYSAFPYMGCFYGCEYCYWRDEKYNRLTKDPEAMSLTDPFAQLIKVKVNAPGLLRQALQTKSKEIIYLDSYQPIEAKYRLVRAMLQICAELNFPVFINEKSPLILQDQDILKRISQRGYVNVGLSIAFSQDNSGKKTFESRTSSINSRFTTMKTLSQHEIITGTIFMPVLPFISDDEAEIKTIVKQTRDSGGRYVLEGGLTLNGYCKTHFLKFLANYDKSLVNKYERLYSDKEKLQAYFATTHRLVKHYCEAYGLANHIVRPVNFYPKEIQGNKRIAEQLYLKSREMVMAEGRSYKQLAYLKAAWSVDLLTENIYRLFEKKGKKGLIALKGIGDTMSETIIKIMACSKVLAVDPDEV
jgi:DNA repair photolyase